MKKYFLKKGKCENILSIVCCLFSIIYGIIRIIKQNNIEGVSFFSHYTIGYFLIVLGILFLITELVCFYTNKLYILKKTVNVLSYILGSLILFDIVILSFVRCFIIALNLARRPNSTYPLFVRLSYILIKEHTRILEGIGITLLLSLTGTVVGLLIGFCFVTLRTLEVTSRDSEVSVFFKKFAIGFVKTFVTIFRGTPMIVQGIIIYYFLPGILAYIFNVDQMIINDIISPLTAGLITVSINTTAYLTEVLRGGIESLNKGQLEAARSLGMSRSKAMLHVVLPQALKNSLPSICNEFIVNIKDTSVLSVISVIDLFYVVDQINGTNGNQDGIFIAAGIYLFLTYGISKVLGFVEKKMNLEQKPLPSSN